MRMFIMWHPPDGWVEEVRSEAEAKDIVQRQYPQAAYSPWLLVFPTSPEARMFVWQTRQGGMAGEPPVAWVITVS